MVNPTAARYPKTVKLKDGSEVLVRLTDQGDQDRLLEFFRDIPEAERVFLREDLTRREEPETAEEIVAAAEAFFEEGAAPAAGDEKPADEAAKA